MPPLNIVKPEIKVDTSVGNWVWFPDSLPGGKFRGFENREDVTQLRGAFVVGQNVRFRGAGLPNLREGSAVLGTVATDTNEVRRAWVYETRNGDQFLMKALGSGVIQFWLYGTSTSWFTLQTGFTADLDWGYAVIDETADLAGSVFYCNGTDSWYRWSGTYATVLSVTGTTITITGSSTFTDLGFTATGSVSINGGTSYAYTGGAGTTTITGIADTTGVAVGAFIVQTPVAVTYTDTVAIKSSVMMAHDGRIHFRNDAKKNVWYYTELDDPDDITNLGTGTDGYGNKKSVETGGPINAFGKLNQAVLAGKNRIVKSLTFEVTGSRVDVPFYKTLIPADDKGTTLGMVNQKSTIATPYGLVFVTPDKRMVLSTGISQNNQPDYLVLSDPIQPFFDEGDHRDGTAICVNNTLFYSYKSSSDAAANDTVLIGDMTRQSVDRVGRVLPIQWDAPVVGWNVNDFTAIQNSDGKTVVQFHSSLNSNTYEITADDKTDDGGGFVSTIRTWSEHMGYPTLWKTVDMLCLDISLRENSQILTNLLYNESGVTAIYEATLLGSLTDYRYAGIELNPFGASAFGRQKFGSNPENAELSLYRFFLELPTAVKFFNLALQLSGNVDGNDFELVRFGFRLKEVFKDTPRPLRMISSS